MDQNRLDFWTYFKNFTIKNNWNLSVEKIAPKDQYYFDINIAIDKPKHGGKLHLSLHMKDNQLWTGLYIDHVMLDYYNYLNRNKETINELLGVDLVWIKDTGKKVSRIKKAIEFNLLDEKQWDKSCLWLAMNSYNFKKITQYYLNGI